MPNHPSKAIRRRSSPRWRRSSGPVRASAWSRPIGQIPRCEVLAGARCMLTGAPWTSTAAPTSAPTRCSRARSGGARSAPMRGARGISTSDFLPAQGSTAHASLIGGQPEPAWGASDARGPDPARAGGARHPGRRSRGLLRLLFAAAFTSERYARSLCGRALVRPVLVFLRPDLDRAAAVRPVLAARGEGRSFRNSPMASGQTIKRTGWSPDGTIIRCACDLVGSKWIVSAKANTRCLFLPLPNS